MAVYVNVDSVHKNVESVWCNIEGIWKKAESLKVNVGGVWKDTLSKKFHYYTSIFLSIARDELSATSFGNYAMFGGGTINASGDSCNTLDVYDTTLTKIVATELGTLQKKLSASATDQCAFFGGGSLLYGIVNMYNTLLTRTTSTNALTQKRTMLTSTNSKNNYVLFGGGWTDSATRSNLVEAFNNSMGKTTPTTLSIPRYDLASASIGDYALFAGGNEYDVLYGTNRVDIYNSSLVRTTSNLTNNPLYLAGASLKNYALFGGGMCNYVGNFDTVDAFNSSVVRVTPITLSQARYDLTATSAMGGDYVLFGGGRNDSGVSKVIDIFDNSLTRYIPEGINELTIARAKLASASVGNYVLFGGGYIYNASKSAQTDVYECK